MFNSLFSCINICRSTRRFYSSSQNNTPENVLQSHFIKLSSVLYSQKRDQDRCVGLLDWALNQVQEDNKALRNRVDDLERLLFEARSQLHERPQTDSGVLKVSDDEYGTWVVRDPKRIGIYIYI